MGLAFIKNASQVYMIRESYGRLSAALRDTMEKWGIL